MSITIMSAIFNTEFFNLPQPDGDAHYAKASSIKLVMLALADHANDEGEAIYPSLRKLERKTALSRQGLLDVLGAMKYNGLIFVSDEPSKLGTNNYTLNLECLPCLRNKEDTRLVVKPLDQGGQATLLGVVKPLDHNHPLTILNHPPEKDKETGNIDLLDGILYYAQQVQTRGLDKDEELWADIERALGITINPDTMRVRSEWKHLHAFLKKKIDKNETIEGFSLWMKTDPFNSPKKHQIVNKPSLVETMWPSAFPPQKKREIKPIIEDEEGCIPMPEEK